MNNAQFNIIYLFLLAISIATIVRIESKLISAILYGIITIGQVLWLCSLIK